MKNRIVALALTVALILTNTGMKLTTVYAADNKISFVVAGSELVRAVDEAVMDGNEVTAEDFNMTNGKAEALQERMFGEGRLLEAYPFFDEDGGKDAEIRVFVRVPENAGVYSATGDEELVILYINHSSDTIGCNLKVTRMTDGVEKVKSTKVVTLKSYERAFGDEETEFVTDLTGTAVQTENAPTEEQKNDQTDKSAVAGDESNGPDGSSAVPSDGSAPVEGAGTGTGNPNDERTDSGEAGVPGENDTPAKAEDNSSDKAEDNAQAGADNDANAAGNVEEKDNNGDPENENVKPAEEEAPNVEENGNSADIPVAVRSLKQVPLVAAESEPTQEKAEEGENSDQSEKTDEPQKDHAEHDEKGSAKQAEENGSGAEKGSDTEKSSATENGSKAENGSVSENGSSTENGSDIGDSSAAENGPGSENSSAAENGPGTGNSSAAENGPGSESSSAAENGPGSENSSAAENSSSTENVSGTEVSSDSESVPEIATASVPEETAKAVETLPAPQEEKPNRDATDDLVGLDGCSTTKIYTTTLNKLRALEDISGYAISYDITIDGAACIVDGPRSVEEGEPLVFGVKNQLGYEVGSVKANETGLLADTSESNSDGSVTVWYSVPEINEETEVIVGMIETGEHPEFSQELEMEDGMTISLHADEGILPAGVTATAYRFSPEIEAVVCEKEGLNAVVLYDVSLWQGEKLLDSQLWNTRGRVTVEMSGAPLEEIKSKGNTVEMIHVELQQDSDLEEKTKVAAEETKIDPEDLGNMNPLSDPIPVESGETDLTIAVDMEHFSTSGVGSLGNPGTPVTPVTEKEAEYWVTNRRVYKGQDKNDTKLTLKADDLNAAYGERGVSPQTLLPEGEYHAHIDDHPENNPVTTYWKSKLHESGPQTTVGWDSKIFSGHDVKLLRGSSGYIEYSPDDGKTWKPIPAGSQLVFYFTQITQITQVSIQVSDWYTDNKKVHPQTVTYTVFKLTGQNQKELIGGPFDTQYKRVLREVQKVWIGENSEDEYSIEKVTISDKPISDDSILSGETVEETDVTKKRESGFPVELNENENINLHKYVNIYVRPTQPVNESKPDPNQESVAESKNTNPENSVQTIKEDAQKESQTPPEQSNNTTGEANDTPDEEENTPKADPVSESTAPTDHSSGSGSGSGTVRINVSGERPGTMGGVAILEKQIPLANIPTDPAPLKLPVGSEDIPLAPLPKTGQDSRPSVITLFSGLLLALTLLAKKRRKEE